MNAPRLSDRINKLWHSIVSIADPCFRENDVLNVLSVLIR